MTSGRKYARKIDDAINELDMKLGVETAKYDQLNQKLTVARTRIAEAFAQIARIHVDAIDVDEIASHDALTRDAARVLERRRAEHASLSTSLPALQATLTTQIAAADVAQGDRDRAAAHVAAISATVDEHLASDPTWAGPAAEAAARHAEAATTKAQAAVAERDAKRGAYESDPIFMYLRQRGFGSSSYRAWPIVRTVDGWLAQLCGFRNAVMAYQALLDLPDYLTEHAAAMQHAAAAAVQKATTARRIALENAGIAEPERHLDVKEAALARADEAVEATRAQVRSTRDAIEKIERWRDETAELLLARMASAFGSESLDALYGRVASTKADDDDRLLQDVIALRTESTRLEVEAAHADGEIKQLKRRRDRLTNVRTKFRNEYNSSDYRISSSASDLLTGYVVGTVMDDALWSGIQRSASYDPPASSASSFSTPSYSGGGFSSGDSFGGGGYSTGGGF